MAGSRAMGTCEPCQVREEAALSRPSHVPRGRLAGACCRQGRSEDVFRRRVRGHFSCACAGGAAKAAPPAAICGRVAHCRPAAHPSAHVCHASPPGDTLDGLWNAPCTANTVPRPSTKSSVRTTSRARSRTPSRAARSRTPTSSPAHEAPARRVSRRSSPRRSTAKGPTPPATPSPRRQSRPAGSARAASRSPPARRST